MGGSDNKGDGVAPGQPLLNRHQVGGVSHSPDGLFAQQEQEPTRGRPAVRGKGTYGGRSGQHVEEQGTWGMDSLWTEAHGQQKQSKDPGNNQHNLNTPTTRRH